MTVQFETSVPAVQAYYKLHSLTRKKHGLPPQPWSFFLNLQQCVLERGCGYVALASLRDRPIAAGVFMHLGKRAIHKFGASDPDCQKLGANHLLMWETIRKYRAAGLAWLDLGRTSMSNDGLRQFKQGFSGQEHRLGTANTIILQVHSCKSATRQGVGITAYSACSRSRCCGSRARSCTSQMS